MNWEGFECENTRRDFAECQVSGCGWKYIPGTLGQRGIFAILIVLLIAELFNVIFKCKNENTFHCRWFQVNYSDTNDIYTHVPIKFWHETYTTYPVSGNDFVYVVFRFLKSWSNLFLQLLLLSEWPYRPPNS